MLTKDAFKSRRFRIWTVCLLVLVIGSAFFLTNRPSQPWVSANFTVMTNYLDGSYLDSKGFTHNESMVTMQVSNRMSFNVEYLILADVKGLTKTYANTQVGERYSIAAHSQSCEVFGLRFWTGKAPTRWRVQYGRSYTQLRNQFSINVHGLG
jgi:hypothetical protein